MSWRAASASSICERNFERLEHLSSVLEYYRLSSSIYRVLLSFLKLFLSSVREHDRVFSSIEFSPVLSSIIEWSVFPSIYRVFSSLLEHDRVIIEYYLVLSSNCRVMISSAIEHYRVVSSIYKVISGTIEHYRVFSIIYGALVLNRYRVFSSKYRVLSSMIE